MLQHYIIILVYFNFYFVVCGVNVIVLNKLLFLIKGTVIKCSFFFRHPVVTLFHLAFRSAALLLYLFCGWFGIGFVTTFVLVVLLLSMDFWTVKNITG